MIQEVHEDGVGVPVQREAEFGDSMKPVSAQYTPAGEGALPRDDVVILDTFMYNIPKNAIILDLYRVDELSGKRKTVPFMQWTQLGGPRGEVVRVWSTVDDGALVNAIDEKTYRKSERRLGALVPSGKWLRMANGIVTPSLGVWRGMFTIAGISCLTDLEVFDGGNAWSLLIGKPLLESLGVSHDYGNDTIRIPTGNETESVGIENQHAGTQGCHDVQGELEEVKPEPSSVWILDTGAGEEDTSYPGEPQPDVSKVFEPTLLTWRTDPFNAERVKAVLGGILIGADLDPKQRKQVESLFAEYADCFALSMSEVLAVDGASHRLDIPRDTVFSTKVGQRRLSPPQKEFYNKVLDTMLDADIIEPIDVQDVKCCGATTLARKAHDGNGLTLDKIQHRVNDQCVTAGMEDMFEKLGPRETKAENTDSDAPQVTKWRVCQDFAELNKVTKVPPMPQGDIRAKQQNLSGHRWVSVFDFASGFYACEIDIEDRLYICFYVEGRGYFCYKRMPFGLTGAPSTFAQMTARALGDLIGILFELFVDDGGMAGDNFNTMLQNTHILLQQVRDTGLSLSATKSRFFMSEATFAGGRVGSDGIKPDLTKLTAIAEWKIPADLQNLGAFLGLAGYFRALIKGYASIAQPLTDLARSDIPRTKGKAAYTRAMKGYSLQSIWKDEHTQAFLRLKVALTSEPVLKGPKFDGTPFIVTTDGCKYGFAGMVSQ